MRDENAISVLLQVLLVAPFFLLYLLWKLSQYFRRRSVASGQWIEGMARHLGGEIARDPAYPCPFVRFERRGHRGYYLVWYLGTSNIRVTTLELCAGIPDLLAVTSPNSRRVTPRFARGVEFGWEGFRVAARDPDDARRMLDEGLGRLLWGLQERFRAPVRIQLAPTRLTIEVERFLHTPEAIELADFLDWLLPLLSAECRIEVLSVRFDPRAGVCPVCGTALTSPVTCGSCKTPHHRECWNYAGRCAIFACGGRQVV